MGDFAIAFMDELDHQGLSVGVSPSAIEISAA
jgi:hypothetical protein